MKYYGCDWLMKSYKIEPSALGKKVADILGMVWCGLYHMDPGVIKKVNWSDPYVIAVRIQQSLSTYDFNELTDLVILCHDQAVRFTVQPNMRYLMLLFHQRTREGSFNQRHPTIEDAVMSCRKRWEEQPKLDGPTTDPGTVESKPLPAEDQYGTGEEEV